MFLSEFVVFRMIQNVVVCDPQSFSVWCSFFLVTNNPSMFLLLWNHDFKSCSLLQSLLFLQTKIYKATFPLQLHYIQLFSRDLCDSSLIWFNTFHFINISQCVVFLLPSLSTWSTSWMSEPLFMSGTGPTHILKPMILDPLTLKKKNLEHMLFITQSAISQIHSTW